ncbi:Uu.00g006880.m01.CDS01 [Anthostomella pinea]|uniref:Uu.00g006880.m01.CDS01 n=1 Tax=Anthostomella pinea TaxID=933095 RepID=A0AAI8YJ60_9PEZI|nr:Uu.00g006880.m01.CDS01 [Anthostomella pinea]
MTSSIETVAFLGASTGVGLSALKHTLATGRRCIALCRNPAKLAAILPTESNPNLAIVQGNAKSVEDVSKCLKASHGKLVDTVVSSIGAAPVMNKLSISIDDPVVCRKGMATLLEAIENLRRDGATGKPYIVACSTTGMSRFGRDIPALMVPLYHVMLKVPHEDKAAMEDRLIASQEDFTIVRMSFLLNGETKKQVRVGIEDPKAGRESEAVGYFITREDAGKWIAEDLVRNRVARYNKKIVMVTH